jgi:tetratricopeptide (TPR) repeat protein
MSSTAVHSIDQSVAPAAGEFASDAGPGPRGSASGALAGAEAVPAVVLMENHDAAYLAWRDASVRDRVLVHIDAHHDAWWVEEQRDLNIANFICRALRENLVREVHWVVPDGSWESRRARGPVLRHLDLLIREYPGGRAALSWEGNQLATVLGGKRFRAGPLSALPPIDEAVLLDIDVDYLVIPRVAYGIKDRHAPVPWCWPEELLNRLAARRIRTDLATVVYSVEGGYTPQEWKFLGDELACRLQSPGKVETLNGFRKMRAGVAARQRGDSVSAVRLFREAAEALPTSAAPQWHLAKLQRELGEPAAGRERDRQALQFDPAYRNPYNTAGWVRLGERRYAAAEREFALRLELDPNDPFSLAGMGQIVARRKDWTGAEALLRQAIAGEPDLVDAHRLLAGVLAHSGRTVEAIAEYRLALKLSLAGCRSLAAGIDTATGERALVDPFHGEVHAQLALLLAREGNVPAAISGLRLAVAAGSATSGRLYRLGELFLRQGQYGAAGSALASALVEPLRTGWKWGRSRLEKVSGMMRAALLAAGLRSREPR